MQKRETIIEYSGHLTFSTIGRLLTLLKNKMTENGIQTGLYKKMLSVMIESLENVYKYSDEYHNDRYITSNYFPRFKIEKENLMYWIECINPIRNIHIPTLKTKLDRVNHTDKKGLKLLYRQTISNGHFTDKGGAGLGIIEMAKISGNPLVYKFEKINDEYSTYFLSIKFSEPPDEENQ